MAGALLDERQRRDWLRLIKTENVGPATFRQLLNRYGGAAEALAALPELSRRGGLSRTLRIYAREAAERDLERADELGARFVALGEPDYPAFGIKRRKIWICAGLDSHSKPFSQSVRMADDLTPMSGRS